MRYLPLKPRLQRLYMSTHTAIDMRWHKEKRVDDDVMRHPADGEAWKAFDRTFPEFAADPRNVRLGLATDGFNPWLSWDHEWREKDKQFDGNTERRLRPREWSGDEILEQLNRLDFAPFGKTVS
ncbi:unnamed protein product, partial [Prunus brigantina]